MLRISRTAILLVFVVIVAVLALPALLARRNGLRPPQLVAPAGAVGGFARATPGYTPAFPQDFGPHLDFQTEWWYYTGNVETSDGRHFGYELTFFRRALAPTGQQQNRLSAWATDQIYMAHFALTDVGERRFHAFEHFARGAAGLAGAQPAPYRVWLENWSVEEVAPHKRRLRATEGAIAIDLLLTDSKGPILEGDRGYSQKGPDQGDASYYYSFTRLVSEGTVELAGKVYQVNGSSWMDHEWSTSALAADQVGWDWFALQLDDGSELMLYHIRRADGSIDPFSSGMLIGADGSTRRLSAGDFTISNTATWRSPHSGATYPARWIIALPTAGLSLTIEPYLADQELNLSFTYWEGAVLVSGQHGGRTVHGDGYVEMTGYAASMQGQF